MCFGTNRDPFRKYHVCSAPKAHPHCTNRVIVHNISPSSSFGISPNFPSFDAGKCAVLLEIVSVLRFIRMDNSNMQAAEHVAEEEQPEAPTVEQNPTPDRWANTDWDEMDRINNEKYADRSSLRAD